MRDALEIAEGSVGATDDGSFRRILFVWSTPRSMSTLLAKCMSRCRGVRVLHEPFTDAYYYSHRRKSTRYGEVRFLGESDYWRYASLSGYEAGITFVKELAFQGSPYIGDDVIKFADHAFLYRHPAAVVRSLLPLKRDFTEDELGFTALSELLRRVHTITGRHALVLNGDELRSSPGVFLETYCRNAALPYSPTMLSWDPGPLREWKDHEAQSQRRWHGTLEASTGVIPPGSLEAVESLTVDDIGQRRMIERATAIFDQLERRRIGKGFRND